MIRRRADTPSGPIDDDRLRLVFTCCHPALSMEAQVALTLKVVSNLSTAAIGRMFLTSENTMGQRLLRAKRKIANAAHPLPRAPAEALPERLDGVLAVIYLVFTEGYATTDDDLADEAIRLGRLLVELMPDSDEARGLLALMLLQHARRAARLVDGELMTLEDQDRSRWDAAAITEALALLAAAGTRARALPHPGRARRRSRHGARRRVDRLAAHRRPLRRAAGDPPVAGRRPQPGGRRWHERRSARRAAVDRCRRRGSADASTSCRRRAASCSPAPGGRPRPNDELDRAIELAPTEPERRQLARRRDELLLR